jgi:MYXO-CTERM domain-containing protein
MQRTLSILALSLFVAGQASANSFDFNVSYSGGGIAALEAGSDDPNGVNLQPGDTFLWNIHAAHPADQWRVVTGGGFFPLMAFAASPMGSRQGDFNLSLRMDGVETFATAETDSVQRLVHVGTNTIELPTGLTFDEMVLEYSLDAMTPADPNDPADTNLSGLLPIFGPPELNRFYPGIVFERVEGVPEPGLLALAGVAALAISRRRRV